MKSPQTWAGTGVLLAATGAVAALLFNFLVVRPAYAPLPDGSYGEWYGPVSSLRVPAYAACGLLVAAGLAGVFVGVLRQVQSRIQVFRTPASGDVRAPRPTITADIEFFPADRGGRRQPVDPTAGTYMPHVVVQGEDYLGIRFVAGPAGPRGRYTLELIYHGDVDYSALQEGTHFTVREGPHVVGEGVVVRPPGDVGRAGR